MYALRRRGALLALLLLCLAAGQSVRQAGPAGVFSASRVAGAVAQPGRTCHTFVETGNALCDTFLAYWRGHGGLAQFGYPISEEMAEPSDADGQTYTVQYFERAVFQARPDERPPNDVQLLPLGAMRFHGKYPGGGPVGATPAPLQPDPAPITTCPATHDDPPGPYVPDTPVRNSVGKGHLLTGAVVSTVGCAPIAGAKVELWPEIGGSHPAGSRATVYTDVRGRYWYESAYPEHIHMRVTAPGYRGIYTNLYHPPPGAASGRFDIALAPDPACLTFGQSGQAVCGRFLDYWRQHGGVEQQGVPVGPELSEVSEIDGRRYTMQYFERAVFERHSENAAPQDVLLSHLGALRYQAKYPAPGRIVATVHMAGEPVKLALGARYVWVATREGMLARIDPATNQLTDAPQPIGFEPHDVSVGEGGVWVSQQEQVARFDPVSGRRVALIQVDVHSNYVPILAAAGSVWIADPAEEVSVVLRIDPATNRVVGARIKVGQEPLFLVAGGDSIWVGSHDSATISRIDPRANRVVATINTGFQVHGLAYADGALWVANYHGHTVAHADPATNGMAPGSTLVGYSFEAISAAGGAVWTAPEPFANDAQPGNDKVTRLDARTGGFVGALHTHATPVDVKAGAGAVWVATKAPNTVLRVAP